VEGQGKRSACIIFESLLTAVYQKLSKLVYACRNHSLLKSACFFLRRSVKFKMCISNESVCLWQTSPRPWPLILCRYASHVHVNNTGRYLSVCNAANWDSVVLWPKLAAMKTLLTYQSAFVCCCTAVILLQYDSLSSSDVPCVAVVLC